MFVFIAKGCRSIRWGRLSNYLPCVQESPCSGSGTIFIAPSVLSDRTRPTLVPANDPERPSYTLSQIVPVTAYAGLTVPSLRTSTRVVYTLGTRQPVVGTSVFSPTRLSYPPSKEMLPFFLPVQSVPRMTPPLSAPLSMEPPALMP